MKFKILCREDVVEACKFKDPKLDKFVGTFIAKADALNLWNRCCGIEVERQLASIIIVSISKRKPHIANLQLLHTFARFRRKGYASKLVELMFREVCANNDVQYFRVSSEPEAYIFYNSLGFKFWGRQKSKSMLSMFKVNDVENISNGVYDKDDLVIKSALFSKRKGGLVEIFEELK